MLAEIISSQILKSVVVPSQTVQAISIALCT